MTSEYQQLVALCEHMGAPRAQAERMAAQLVKRADQLVAERGATRVEAMSYLLGLVRAGQRGETPPGFEGIRGSSGQSPV